MNNKEAAEKIKSIAKQIMTLSRSTLLVNLRFLDVAVSKLTLFETEAPESKILTDGEYILYNPTYILKSFKVSKETPVREYLHMLMHCIFRHMFIDPTLNREYWDIACDIAVENSITELNLNAVHTDRQQSQLKFFSAIKAELKTVTAEKIYSYLRTSYPDPAKLAEIRALFEADDHRIWYMNENEKIQIFGLPDNRTKTDEANETDELDLSEEWQRIAERMQIDIESFNHLPGDTPGGLVQNLKSVTREKYDYSSFLRKFAVRGETLKTNNEEFDYIFYTYGLELYDNMPLVEPLEYKEIVAIKEFVIAIDTSGSTSGELVQKFVQKTFNILKSTESFFTKIDLHIIQCDAAIQEDVRITTQEDFDEYIKTMSIHGLGGTDFRPVFEYVSKLRKEGELTNMKGLIYFTDGYGCFPEKKPDYDTAFVFIDDEYNNLDVPPWAIKLVLQPNEI